MKYIKKYNEASFEKKNVDEIVDEILDRLSNKESLSKSEKEFMDAASKGEVIDATVPKMTGNFWADMSNPHNIGTMWKDKNGVWRNIKEDNINDNDKDQEEDSEQKYNREKKEIQESYLKEIPTLKNLLEELCKIHTENDEKVNNIYKKIKDESKKIKNDNRRYTFMQKVDHAIKSKYSLENQFGYIIPIDLDN